MLHVFAIGGGELETGETRALDEQIVRATGKLRPRALFIPTASDDAEGYCETFEAVYGGALGCAVETLLLVRATPAEEEIAATIARADLIYVGGGNTRRMLATWRARGVDRSLIAAGERGTVLAGLSAGAICWFRHGNSDAPVIEGQAAGARKTMRVDGLALVDATLCPHMNSEPYRWEEFPEMMRTTAGVGLGLDDGAAIEVHGERCRILSVLPGAAAHHLHWHHGRLSNRRIEPAPAMLALRDLLDVDRTR